MSILKVLPYKIAGNWFAQTLLEKTIKFQLKLLGIGSGGGVELSGEKGIFKVLKQQVQAPYCIFDVGANKGDFLKLALENVSTNDFTIHCFEPGKGTFDLLTKSSTKDNRITLNNIGLGREKSEASLYYDVLGSGLASLTKRNLAHFNKDFNDSETVIIDTVDDYCKVNSIERIHLLKIDVEGHELDVLMGAKMMFSSKSIDIVTFEFGGCNIDTKTFFQDFWYFFKSAQFTLFRVTPSGYMFRITSYKEIYEQFRTSNFIAVSNK